MEVLQSDFKWSTVCLGVFVIATVFLLSRKNNFIRFQFKFVHFGATLSLMAFWTIPFFAFNLPHVKNSWCARYVNTSLTFLSTTLGITWVMRNKEILAEERGCVIVSNHQSSMDILAMMCKWVEVGKWAAIAKKELFYFWPYGLVAWLGGTVFIDRYHPDKAKEQLKLAVKRIKEERTKLWFFPEGTRNPKGGSFLPFKKGAFHTAILCQVPIIPIVFSPYYFINEEKYIFGSGHIVMHVMQPIPTTGMTLDSIDELSATTRNLMLEKYHELSIEVQPETARI